MRALSLESYDGPGALRESDVAVPEPSRSDVLIRVRAIGINYPDLLATRGEYQHRPETPFVPGCEIAGTIEAVPEGSRWAIGDRVAGFVWDGGYAEYAVAPQGSIARLPADADFAAGAAMVVNSHTVHFALARRGALQPGETVLVMGAGGGIGSAAVQVAKGLGARVIAGVASEEQRPVAIASGADDVVLLREGFSSAVRDLTDGRGVNVALDPLGDWLFAEATRCLAPEGRILVVGFAAGEIPTVRVNRLLLRNVSAVGVAWGALLDVDPSLMADGAAALERMFDAGHLRPQVGSRVAFDEIPDALARLGRGEIAGKAVAAV